MNTIDEILADLREGKMAVVVDDEDRENEGDLIVRRRTGRAEDDEFHGALWAGTDLPHAHAGTLPGSSGSR